MSLYCLDHQCLRHHFHHYYPKGHHHHHDDHLDGQAGHLRTNQGQCSPQSSSCKGQLVQGFGKPATDQSVRGPGGLIRLESASNTGLTSMSRSKRIAFSPTTSSSSYSHHHSIIITIIISMIILNITSMSRSTLVSSAPMSTSPRLKNPEADR